ncbi:MULTISPECIES: hypothetical protein [Hydrocarboniphaga]|uniref:hypothetical protein n=1 Tax=Hydrocarboniphaga TaxID=243627 RepID=UPI0012FCB142|nr:MULTISPECIES: hypothetical protein [Hydrocarboniphaga]MDZ4078647.1 hypothetical protein [Hydrocarboniphaga sp.]
MHYNEVCVDGRCSICDTDLPIAKTAPQLAQQNKELDALIYLVRECRKWGKSHDFPAAREYPHYSQLRTIGRFFFEIGGRQQMRRALRVLSEELGTADASNWGRFVEFAWDDIGGWKA